MKILWASAALMFWCAGCFEMKEVDLVYFNLGPNEIFVDSIEGLPSWAAPGYLVPAQAEDPLSRTGATSFDNPVHVSATLKIFWREGGKLHKAEFKRDEVGIPETIKKGKVRFTYLGGDKWRVKVLE